MARPLRMAVADGVYHLSARELEQREIFRVDTDRRHLLEVFGLLQERFRTGKATLCRRVRWQEVRAAVEELKGEPRDQLADRRGDERRDLSLWAGRRFCGMTVNELAAAVGAEYAAASVAIRRLEQRAACNNTLRDLQAKLSAMLIVAP